MANGDHGQEWDQQPPRPAGYQLARLVTTVERIGFDLERFRQDINKQFDKLDVDVKAKIKELEVKIEGKADKKIENIIWRAAAIVGSAIVVAFTAWVIKGGLAP